MAIIMTDNEQVKLEQLLSRMVFFATEYESAIHHMCLEEAHKYAIRIEDIKHEIRALVGSSVKHLYKE